MYRLPALPEGIDSVAVVLPVVMVASAAFETVGAAGGAGVGVVVLGVVAFGVVVFGADGLGEGLGLGVGLGVGVGAGAGGGAVPCLPLVPVCHTGVPLEVYNTRLPSSCTISFVPPLPPVFAAQTAVPLVAAVYMTKLPSDACRTNTVPPDPAVLELQIIVSCQLRSTRLPSVCIFSLTPPLRETSWFPVVIV